MNLEAVLLATRSDGKLRELRPLFGAAGIRVLDLREAQVRESAEEDSVEAFETFADNALAKARYFQVLTGLPTIADDSGLEVEALEGRPGVRSKRYSGRTDLTGQPLDDANNAKLLESLRAVGRPRARYVCAAAYADNTREEVVLGETAGTIIRDARGREGFGYDPYFLSDELGATFGESSREAKERVSHRGRAFRALLERLSAQR
jgi:XTP/dITP diphosphohydrolase